MGEFFDAQDFADGFRRATGQRLDAGETAALAGQLEHVYRETYDVERAERLARKFVPVDSSVHAAAEYYTYYQWDNIGMAKIIADYATDLPRVTAQAAKFVASIHSLGASYGYSIMDLRRSQMAGSQLDTREALAARDAHEQAFDELVAVGNAAAGFTGFLNSANVPIVGATTGQWVTNSATPLQMLADLHKLVNSVISATQQTMYPDTLLLSTPAYETLNSTPMSVDNSKSVLKHFLENSPHITGAEQWYRLDDAGAAAVSRIVAYKRDARVVSAVEPQPFEQFPPQAKGLEFEIATHSRMGGVKIPYPLGIAYMDDLDG